MYHVCYSAILLTAHFQSSDLYMLSFNLNSSLSHMSQLRYVCFSPIYYLQYSPLLSWHRSPRICVFVFVFFFCVFVLENMRLRSWKYAFSFFFAFLRSFALLFFFTFSFFFLRFLRSRVNGWRSRCISFSSLSYNMTLFFIKNQKKNVVFLFPKAV